MQVFGLFGEKLSHSLSPTIHSMLYDELNIQATYSLYQIQPPMLKDAVQAIRTLAINGVNVTIPYKLKVMEYLDDISDEALRIGAVNTISNTNNVLTGYNTDYTGFGRMLYKYGIKLQNKTATVIGSGGAAKSVVTFLEDNDISKIHIISRDPSKVVSFDKYKYNVIDYNQLDQIEDKGLIINCTPCGMYPNIECSPIEKTKIQDFTTVIDLIYNPSSTLLMKYAESNGILAINGLYMLVAQAAAAVEIWTGQKIDNDIVDVVYERLKQRFDNK